jgi:hypothetical protein
MNLALDRYTDAATLLLPPRHGGPDRFELSEFREAMAQGDRLAGDARDALP